MRTMLYKKPLPQTSISSTGTPYSSRSSGRRKYSVRTVVLTEEPVAEKAEKSCSPSRSRAHRRIFCKSYFPSARTAYRSRRGTSCGEKYTR